MLYKRTTAPIYPANRILASLALAQYFVLCASFLLPYFSKTKQNTRELVHLMDLVKENFGRWAESLLDPE